VAIEVWREVGVVDVGGIGTEDESRFSFAWDLLEEFGLADGELDGVRVSVDERFDSGLDVFDALEERGFAEEAVIDGDIETFAGGRVEEAVEAVGFHSVWC